jgi:hypothetical protein
LGISARNSISNATPAAEFILALPTPREIYLFAPTGAWAYTSEVAVYLYWPTDAPPDAQVLAHAKDSDYLWYQKLLPGFLTPGAINRLKIETHPSDAAWEPVGHTAPWTLRSLTDPREFAIRIFSPARYTGTCRVERAEASWRQDSAPPFIRNVSTARSTVKQYERFEVSFELPDRYPNPFAPDTVHVTATFDTPTGGPPVTVDGFYTRDHARSLSPTGEQTLPVGLPRWKVRFCPTAAGTYQYRIHAKDALGTAEWGPGTFTATASRHPGFVRVSPRDRRFYECDDGSFFFPIGHNIRSPFDTRADGAFPWQQRWPEGSMAYERYLKDMTANGENYVEIWTAAWSLGLEWNRNWRGYNGIGQYSLKNAWELDRILEQAEASNIRVNLVIHNHGKFSTSHDQEWTANPFNIANGGYLEKPEDYFTDPRARQSFLNLMRYMIARWGYSPNILAWQLWSELDLTGSSNNWFWTKECVEWHDTMGQAVKGIDPYDHLIGTHFCPDYRKQNTNITALAVIDHCPADAYHSSPNALEIVPLMRETAAFMRPLDKPALITEFGGSPSAGQGYKHVDLTLHAALWASTGIPLGGTPMFWWWMIVEEAQLYPRYAAVSRFMKDSDLRNPSARLFTTPYTPSNIAAIVSADWMADIVTRDGITSNANWRIECFGTPERAQGWIYNASGFETLNPATDPPDNTLSIRFSGLDKASYEVEFWDTIKGQPIHTAREKAHGNILVVPIPPTVRDVAFKLRKITT